MFIVLEQDVISSHFTIRATKVRSWYACTRHSSPTAILTHRLSHSIEKWAKTNPRIRNFTAQQLNGAGMFGLGMNAYLPAPPMPPQTGTSWYTNAFNPYSQHRPNVPLKPAETAGMDLLAAFDKGMKIVRQWPQAWQS